MDSDCALWRHMARRDISTEEVSLWDCVWIAFRFMRSINPFINPKKLQGSDGPVFEGQVKVRIDGSWEVYRMVGGYCVDFLGGQITTTWVNTRWCTTNGRREHVVSHLIASIDLLRTQALTNSYGSHFRLSPMMHYLKGFMYRRSNAWAKTWYYIVTASTTPLRRQPSTQSFLDGLEYGFLELMYWWLAFGRPRNYLRETLL
jgi:hypothetical protein